MVQWDTTGTKGAMGRYEIIVFPDSTGWAYILWTNKTILTRQDSLVTKEAAQNKVSEMAERLSKDSMALERSLYPPSDDDEEG